MASTIKLRLYNGDRQLRNVEIPEDVVKATTSGLSLLSAVEQTGDRISELLSEPQIRSIITAAEESAAKVRSTNPVVLNAVDEWLHTVRGIRKYKVNANLNAGRNLEHIAIVLDAWPAS
jgi:hypothetical protein